MAHADPKVSTLTRHLFSIRLGALVIGLVMMDQGLLQGRAAAQELSAPNSPQRALAPSASLSLQKFMAEYPLRADTWQLWADRFVRSYHEDHPDDYQDATQFFETMQEFVGSQIAGGKPELPAPWHDDACAWAVLSGYFMNQGSQFALAEFCAREALKRDDPQKISTLRLASVLAWSAAKGRDSGQPFVDIAKRADEAEKLLQQAQAELSGLKASRTRAMIALARGDKERAEQLFLEATEEFPHSVDNALLYLGLAINREHGAKKITPLVDKFVERMPLADELRVIRALGLHIDGQVREAADLLAAIKRENPRALGRFDERMLRQIAEGSWMTPELEAAQQHLNDSRFIEATTVCRKIVAETPDNILASKLFAKSLVMQYQNAPPDRLRLARVTEDMDRLVTRFPDEPVFLISRASVYSQLGNYNTAWRDLQQAERLGINLQTAIGVAQLARLRRYAGEQNRADEIHQQQQLAIQVLAGIGVGWGGWIAIMFAIGMVLAISIPRVPDKQVFEGDHFSQREVWIERLYVSVMSLALLIFYLSVPIVALGLIAFTLALFFLFLCLRLIHFGILYRGLWATWHVMRCAVLGPSNDVVGIEAKSEQHPQLFASINSVADRVGTPSVDQVLLAPTGNICVYQHGLGILRRSRRVLEIGLPILPMLTKTEFESILAHEFGHFSHNDTFYGRFIFRVSSALAVSLAIMHAAGGWLNYLNPFYWFYWLYLRAYALLASGFSRSREFLADRCAVFAYGKEQFASGLTKVCVRGPLFEEIIYRHTRELLSDGKAMINAFDSFRQFCQSTETNKLFDETLSSLRTQKPSWFDTHPTYVERLAAIESLHVLPKAIDSRSAAELITDLPAIEEQLTDLLTARIHAALVEQE